MSVCWLVIGDGRDDYHEASFTSAQEALPQPDALVQVDDRDHKLGFAGAIQAGWAQVLDTGCDWCFHLEADFTFNRPVPLDRMIAVLQRHPEIVQIALKRQPVNAEEKRAGGIVELEPDAFEQRHEGGDLWTIHRRFFTTNPSVYPTVLCNAGWPQEPESEGIFTHRLFDHDPHAFSAFWGAKFDPPLVEHIGDQRQGHGY